MKATIGLGLMGLVVALGGCGTDGAETPAAATDTAAAAETEATVDTGTEPDAATTADTVAAIDAPPPPKSGKSERTLTVDGVEREFLVHVPATLDASKAVPVVFMLHGTSGSGDKFYNISGWVEKADAEGFIAVFPSALAYCLGDDEDYDAVIEASEYKVTTKWAAGKLGTAVMPLCTEEQITQLPKAKQDEIASHTLRDDLAFFDAMVASVVGGLPVDVKRLYVTGFSNGAQMSARLMMERTNTFAAFAMAAGSPAVPGPALRPVSAVFSVGSLDDGFLTKSGVAELPLDESLLDLPSFSGLAATLGAALQIDATKHTYDAKTANGKTIGMFSFDQSLAGAGNKLIIAVIEDATHQYPNGKNHPAVMTEFLWKFFSNQTLP